MVLKTPATDALPLTDLWRKTVPPAQENPITMHQLRGLNNHSTPQIHPTELAMLLSPGIPALAFNTQSPVKVPANSSCICKPVLGRHVFILPFTPVTKYSSTGSTLVQIMAYVAIAASFLYRLYRQEIGLRNRMLPVLMFLTWSVGGAKPYSVEALTQYPLPTRNPEQVRIVGWLLWISIAVLEVLKVPILC